MHPLFIYKGLVDKQFSPVKIQRCLDRSHKLDKCYNKKDEEKNIKIYVIFLSKKNLSSIPLNTITEYRWAFLYHPKGVEIENKIRFKPNDGQNAIEINIKGF